MNTMREALSDLLKYTASLFPTLHVVGSDDQTIVKAMTEDKNIIFYAKLKTPLPVFNIGESAMPNLGLLNGLLNFPSYNSDGATIEAKTAVTPRGTIVEKIEFRDTRGAGSTYRLSDPRVVAEEKRPPEVTAVQWELELEPNRASLDEFAKLASLYSDVDGKLFRMKTVNGNLQFSIGDEDSSTHHASMVFEEGVGVSLGGSAKYPIQAFQSTLKLAAAHPTRLHLNSRGLMMVGFETPYATYSYYIRGEH